MTWPLVGIFILLAIAALKIGSTLMLPIVVSVLFAFLLGAPVRWLRRRGLKEGLGAGIVVFGTVAVLGLSIYFLSAPAADWLERAPQSLAQAERKLRRLAKPFRTMTPPVPPPPDLGRPPGADRSKPASRSLRSLRGDSIPCFGPAPGFR